MERVTRQRICSNGAQDVLGHLYSQPPDLLLYVAFGSRETVCDILLVDLEVIIKLRQESDARYWIAFRPKH